MKLLVKVNDIKTAFSIVEKPEIAAICLPRCFSFIEGKEFVDIAKKNGKEIFIDFCFMMLESEVSEVKEELSVLSNLDFDYLIYTDIGVMSLAKEAGLAEKLFYDGGSLLTNSLDAYFYRNQNAGAFLARELTLEEIRRISYITKGKISFMMAGFLAMSISRRHFVRSYFDYLGKNEEVSGLYWLQEEKRKEQFFPITEDRYGSVIYTDGIYLPYEEWEELASLCEYGMIDATLLKNEELLYILEDILTLTKENAMTKLEAIRLKFPERTFDTAYLYRKTNVQR